MRTIRNQKLVGAALASSILLLSGISGCSKNETSQGLVANAKEFIKKGDSKSAVIQLKNALLKDPSDIDARLMLGALYNETGDPVSAEKEFRRAMELGVKPDKTVFGLATALLSQQQFKKVLDIVEGATGPDLLVLRGDALLALGKNEEAKDAYDQALKAKAEFSPALLGTARYMAVQKDFDGATRVANHSLARNSHDVNMLMFKAGLLRVQGKSTEALATYDQVLKIQPAHRSVNIEKASLNIAAGKLDAARADLASARKITPNDLQLMYTEALLEHSAGKHATARDIIQKVLKVAPEHLSSNLLAGAIEHSLGSMQLAQQHLRKYLNGVPTNTYARKLLVSTMLKLGQTREAVTMLEPMMAKPDAQILALAGEAAMQEREFSKASNFYEQAAKMAPDAAELRTSLALSRLAQGDVARGAADLEESTKLDTSSTKAGMLLVMAEMRLKRFDKAQAVVNELAAKHPTDPVVQNLKGGVLLAKGDAAGGRSAFEKALALNPTFFPAAANLAEMAMRDNDPVRARKVFIDFLQKDKKSIDAMSGLAQLAKHENKPAEMTQWLEKAQAENPDAVAPAIMLGARYLATGANEKAMKLARKFQVANPTNPQLLELLAKAQIANGDKEGALESYGTLVGLMPKSAPVFYQIASLHMQAKNTSAASDNLKKALAINPGLLEAQVASANLAMMDSRPDEALSMARQIQKQHAKNPVGFLLEGNFLRGQRKFLLAIRPYEQALSLAPTSFNMLLLHAAMTSAGKRPEAEARLAKYQKEHHSDATMKTYMADRALAIRDFKQAASILEGLVQEVPRNAVALNNLAWAYHQLKDPRAQKTAEQALALAPNNPAILDTLGSLMVDLGNTAAGLPHLQKAAKLAPEDPSIHYHLAQGLAKTGDKTAARKALEKAMANKNFNSHSEAQALYKQL